ncbi:MAG TPA: hypothetical protein VFD30_04955 [Terriglobia bacterium]|jgi:hypothetical protein|nr:hypothetical protein [Terriglobia bacterium]
MDKGETGKAMFRSGRHIGHIVRDIPCGRSVAVPGALPVTIPAAALRRTQPEFAGRRVSKAL